VQPNVETQHYVYLLRLLAFLLILAGVIDKNRTRAGRRPPARPDEAQRAERRE
jgi:hypothetical protein